MDKRRNRRTTRKKLYNINKEKTASSATGLDFTFGGFTYKGDTANESDIESGNIITSRNQSVTPQSGYGTPKYSGWQVLESEEKDGKKYVKKLVHAGSPENFVYHSITYADGYRGEYILSGGTRQTDYNTYQARDWSKYRDKKLDEKGYISDVHTMTYDEACKITNAIGSTNGIRNTNAAYWLSSTRSIPELCYVNLNGSVNTSGNVACLGVRLLVEMNDGVYIKSGTGTESDPYVLGKD